MNNQSYEKLFISLLLSIEEAHDHDKRKDLKHHIRKICEKYRHIYTMGMNENDI